MEQTLDPFYSERSMTFLLEGVEELNEGKGVRKTMEELEAMEQTLNPFYSEKNMAFLLKGVEELNAGKGVEHELIEVDDK